MNSSSFKSKKVKGAEIHLYDAIWPDCVRITNARDFGIDIPNDVLPDLIQALIDRVDELQRQQAAQ